MSTSPKYLGSLGVWRMIVAAFTLVCQHASTFLPLILLFCLPVDLLYDVLTSFAPFKGLAGTVLLWNLYTVVNFFGYSVLAWEVGHVLQGEPASFRNALRRVSGRMTLRLWGTLMVQEVLVIWPYALICIVGGFIAGLSSPFLGAAAGFGLYVLIALAGMPVLIWRALNFTLTPWVTVFEGKFYRAAVYRSKEIVTGRRVWLFFLLAIEVACAVAIPTGLHLGLSKLLGRPIGVGGGLSGFALDVIENILFSFFGAAVIAFDTLVYFRLRREKKDLTFFTMAETSMLRPASAVLESGGIPN